MSPGNMLEPITVWDLLAQVSTQERRWMEAPLCLWRVSIRPCRSQPSALIYLPLPVSFTFTHNHALLAKPQWHTTIRMPHSHIYGQLGWFYSACLIPGPRLARVHISHGDSRSTEGKSQPLRHISSFYLCLLLITNSPLAKASLMAKVKGKRQGSIPNHREATVRVWIRHAIRGESRTGADHLIPK